MKKRKLKTKNILKGIILIIIAIDFIYLYYNWLSGVMLTWLGVISLVFDITIIGLLVDDLKKDYK